MGARHALFRPFAAPRPVEIPESPRGWYGADRQTRQGRPRFCRAAVLRLRRRGRGRDLPRITRSKCSDSCVRQRTQTHAIAGGDPRRHPGDILADRALPEQPCEQAGDDRGREGDRCSKDTYPQARAVRGAMRHDGTGARLANASDFAGAGLRCRASQRPRPRRRSDGAGRARPRGARQDYGWWQGAGGGRPTRRDDDKGPASFKVQGSNDRQRGPGQGWSILLQGAAAAGRMVRVADHSSRCPRSASLPLTVAVACSC